MKSKLLIYSLTVILIGSPLFSLITPASAEFDCLTLNSSSSSADRTFCQNQLTQLEEQLKALNSQLASQKSHSGSLQGDINVLTTKIKAKTTEIKSKQIKISQLSESITEKQSAIKTLDEKIDREKDSLAQLIRKTDQMDRTTLVSFLISSKSLSEFYSDVSRYDTLKEEVKNSVDNINTIKGVTQQKKAELLKEQDQTFDEKQNLQQIQKTLSVEQTNQKSLLSISKNKEKEYQKVIADQQAKVAQIKAKLFTLAGGSQAIRFDVALQYANQASAKTGVDPAFLLAELTQESNLGANVGRCYLTDITTGAGVNITSGKTYPNVMKASRDVPPFLEVTSRLGYDPMKTAVSCPIAGVAGYGGAMGPAQFIASTWKLFEKRLKVALGRDANPWVAEDAFMASAMYLADLGGTGKSASAQLRAACKYYGSGGATCSYGRSVQALKVKIQADIDYLNQYGISRR
ncbi:MAG: lytic murein transglycosylase [Candidatus Pacebacteria bacterium]|nr:lytic murein transglycosylase [Candidatus Paceibacterota bacterium]